MSIRLSVAALICSVLPLAAAEPGVPKTQKSELGWGTVIMPLAVKPSEALTFTVTLKKIPDKATKVHFDLHWLDAAGQDKGTAFGSGGKDIVLNKPIAFTVAIESKEGMPKVLPILYLSSDGTWAGLVGEKPKLPALDVIEPKKK